ncbi:MAG: cytochrome c3 family protein [Chloroflexota bacterium]
MKRLRIYLIVMSVAVLLIGGGTIVSEAAAGSRSESEAVMGQAPSPQAENDTCLACHSQPGFSVQLKSGEPLPLTIDPQAYAESTHGSNDVTCVTCHSDIEGFPHPERTAESLREFKLDYYTVCKNCHEEQFNLTLDSVHEKSLAAGNLEAAVCTDCHNPHTQQRLTDPQSGELLDYARLHIPQTCAQCHSAIYDQYKESVHGKALTEDGNLDVPTCTDCHGVHNISSPLTASFRNSIPFLCAECHTNNALMRKYGLSTQVLNTYVADFHGTTVVLFDKTFPDQPTNKPVCTDCHGVHDIARADDPNKGLAVRENLLARCQVCHPGATANFPEAWMSHYIPSPEKYPLVYYVNLFYKFFIPAVLGPMLLLVVMDFSRAMINRYKEKKAVKPLAAPADAPAETETKAEETPAPEAVEETPPLEANEPVEEPAAAAAPAEAQEEPSVEEQPGEAEQAPAESEAADESKSADEEETSHD